MAADHARPIVPPKAIKTDYPVIDTDPHIKRVFGYARKSDWAIGAGLAAVGPLLFAIAQRVQPVLAPPQTYTRCLRLACAIGATGGLITVYQRSCQRFLGFRENAREEAMDMREMVDKIKRGEPLYGESKLSPYMQGVAARNSRYASLFSHAILWPNLVNHNQHGVDTAKYYRQAELELEAERNGGTL
ncbi:hypothetical protein VTO42DRAFT_8608 [Malbranchea cinnamomea]